jgi:hypothetical protein
LLFEKRRIMKQITAGEVLPKQTEGVIVANTGGYSLSDGSFITYEGANQLASDVVKHTIEVYPRVTQLVIEMRRLRAVFEAAHKSKFSKPIEMDGMSFYHFEPFLDALAIKVGKCKRTLYRYAKEETEEELEAKETKKEAAKAQREADAKAAEAARIKAEAEKAASPEGIAAKTQAKADKADKAAVADEGDGYQEALWKSSKLYTLHHSPQTGLWKVTLDGLTNQQVESLIHYLTDNKAMAAGAGK